MQKNFIIRNQEDYLRAHITVLRRSPRKFESETQRDNVTKSDPHKRTAVNGSRKPAKPLSFLAKR